MRHARTPSERAEELSAPTALAALRAEREAAVVRWRRYVCGRSLHRSEPLHAQLSAEPLVAAGQPGRWLADDDAPQLSRAIHVGYDADGAVALAHGLLGDGTEAHLLSRDGDVEELVAVRHLDEDEGRADVSVRHLERDAQGRVARVLDDEGLEQRYRYDDAGRVAELEQRRRGAEVERRRVVWDARGEVERVELTSDDGRPAEVVWSAVLHAQEDEEPPPLTETIAGIGAELAAVYVALIAEAAAELPDGRVVVIRGLDAEPGGAVLGDACIDGFRRHAPDPDAVLDNAFRAASRRDDALPLDIVGRAGPALQRRLRRWRQRSEWLLSQHGGRGLGANWIPAGEEALAGDELARRETRELLTRLNGPGGAPLLTVLWSNRERSWEATIATAGDERVAQLQERLAVRGAAAAPVVPSAPVRTRADLRAALLAKGLERVADAIVADARIAIALRFGPGRSRLGGVPELPVGVEWPQLGGKALVPLASIDCAELPAEADDRDLLPADGTLLIFAALHDDEHERPLLLFREEAPAGVVRVLHLPSGTATQPVEPPAELRERAWEPGLLHERTVAPRTIVTLRDRLAAPDLFGLSAGEAEAYDALYIELWDHVGVRWDNS